MSEMKSPTKSLGKSKLDLIVVPPKESAIFENGKASTSLKSSFEDCKGLDKWKQTSPKIFQNHSQILIPGLEIPYRGHETSPQVKQDKPRQTRNIRIQTLHLKTKLTDLTNPKSHPVRKNPNLTASNELVKAYSDPESRKDQHHQKVLSTEKSPTSKFAEGKNLITVPRSPTQKFIIQSSLRRNSLIQETYSSVIPLLLPIRDVKIIKKKALKNDEKPKRRNIQLSKTVVTSPKNWVSSHASLLKSPFRTEIH